MARSLASTVDIDARKVSRAIMNKVVRHLRLVFMA